MICQKPCRIAPIWHPHLTVKFQVSHFIRTYVIYLFLTLQLSNFECHILLNWYTCINKYNGVRKGENLAFYNENLHSNYFTTTEFIQATTRFNYKTYRIMLVIYLTLYWVLNVACKILNCVICIVKLFYSA